MENKKLFIGVSINGVLRDFFGKIEKTHSKYFFREDVEEIEVKDYDLEKWITFPEEEIVHNEIEFDPNFSESDFIKSEGTFITKEVKEEKVTVQDFVYDKCCLEIFGYAEEVLDGVVHSINELDLHIKEKGLDVTLIITSRETGRSIPATLFFLSKTGCMLQNIKFTLGTTDCWEFVDCMITDHPEILKSKPEGKKTIKIEKEYNQEIQSDYTIKSVKELIGMDMFN
jgi:hypothetical protein